jgi:hypothetical protein
MKIKHLAKRETKALDTLCDVFQLEVESVVIKIKGEKFKFFSLPQNESYRLLRLRVWMERYQVDLPYILGKLLPFWQQWIPKKSKALRGQGLGVRISTLTGKKSEQMLQDFIKQDFPSDQNKLLKRSFMQEMILGRELDTSEDGIKVASDSTKTLFDFPNPKGYLQYYRRHLRRQRDRREHIIQEFKKRPYRGNPFV